MSSKSIILIGGPDSGKTNYIGRLWASLKNRIGTLQAVGMPSNIEYVNETVEHLMKGRFAPRSDRNLEEGRRDFSVNLQSFDGGPLTELIMPDISGELWRNAVRDSELPIGWMEELAAADGALLFVRVHSELNVQPADWVTARTLLQHHGKDEPVEIPTQVLLCELLRYLNLYLSDRSDGTSPRVAIIISAWDRLDIERKQDGPIAYLKREFPLFAGRLADPERLDIKVFGLTILGGDLDDDDDFSNEIKGKEISGMGTVTVFNNEVCDIIDDITLPTAWVIGD